MSAFDPPWTAVHEVVNRALAEDLEPLGDLTAALLPPDAADAYTTASLVVRQPGVLAGTFAAGAAFQMVASGAASAVSALGTAPASVEWAAADGERISAGQVVGRASGRLSSLLAAERTALNLLGHLSGIATLTSQFVAAAGPGVIIRDTRKTTPGLRALEKAAVRAGGGANHRGSLSDGVLVKDNHLAGIGVGAVVAAARRVWPGRPCQVECDDLIQVREALAAGADAVLLDNFTVEEVAEAVGVVAKAVPVEVSGGVTLDNVAAYAAAGPDWIAVGAITHSAPSLDIGMDL